MSSFSFFYREKKSERKRRRERERPQPCSLSISRVRECDWNALPPDVRGEEKKETAEMDKGEGSLSCFVLPPGCAKSKGTAPHGF